MLEHLLEILTAEAPYETSESSNLRYARCSPLASTAALTIVSLHIPETAHQQWFARILSRLLIQSGLFTDTVFPRNVQIASELHKQSTPSMVVRESLRSLLARHPVTYALDERTWTDFEDPLHYSDAVSGIIVFCSLFYIALFVFFVHSLLFLFTGRLRGQSHWY